MLFFEAGDKIAEILAALEVKLQDFVASLNQNAAEIAYSPDNLDGQFVSPHLFQEHLAGSYRQSASTLHQQGKRFAVHVGGPVRRLLAPLAASGIDGLEGIAGPPQSDASLARHAWAGRKAVPVVGRHRPGRLAATARIPTPLKLKSPLRCAWPGPTRP